MTTNTQITQLHLQEVLTTQRSRLLGLCIYLTGDPDCAEDVLQEVMLEAWRSFDRLRNPEAVDAWLNGIVRNVCARWQRTRGRESAILLHDDPIETGPVSALDSVADEFDLEVALEKHELATLLDRALALLPETTRDVLVSKYIAESRHAEIARQLGLTENAVTVRLHRGKVALRKLLTTELRAEAETFGLVTPGDSWTETRIWCPKCGERRMMGKLTETEFALRCPTCSVEPEAHMAHTDWTGHESPLGQLKSFRPIIKRFAVSAFENLSKAIEMRGHFCARCGVPAQLHLTLPEHFYPSMQNRRGIYVVCPKCKIESIQALSFFALTSPEGRDFLKAHPRIRTLPEQEIELDGTPAIVLSFESVTSSATFDMMVHRDTYTILASHRSDGT